MAKLFLVLTLLAVLAVAIEAQLKPKCGRAKAYDSEFIKGTTFNQDSSCFGTRKYKATGEDVWCCLCNGGTTNVQKAGWYSKDYCSGQSTTTTTTTSTTAPTTASTTASTTGSTTTTTTTTSTTTANSTA